MKRTERRIATVLLIIALLILIISNMKLLTEMCEWLFGIFRPILIGVLIAFFLSIPLKKCQFFLKNHSRHAHSERYYATWSLILILMGVCAVGGLLFGVLIPALLQSISDIFNTVQEKLPILIEKLSALGIHLDFSADTSILQPTELLKTLFVGSGNILGTVFSTVSTTIGLVTDILISLILAVYLLLEKERIKRQLRLLMRANFSKSIRIRIRYTNHLITKTFTDFLCGQCLEAVILGILIWITFSVFGISYAGVIGVLTGICSFIPVVGACFSCCIGAFLNLMIDPWKAVLCIILYLVIQFIEGHFIYPRVIGNSIGLSTFWVFASMIIGQSLFGIFGMIFSIPMASVLYTLLKQDTIRKLKQRNK